MTSQNKGYALVAFAATGWGTWPLILRHAKMPAALQSTIVMAVFCMAALPFMLRGDRLDVRATKAQWLGVLWIGIADAMNMLLFFAAYQYTTVAIAVLTHYLAPIFIAIAAPFVLREKMPLLTIGAVAISFFGLVLLLEPWRVDLSMTDLIGAALGAGSAVFYASNVLVSKRLFVVFSASELMFFHGFIAVPILWLAIPSGALASTSPTALWVVTVGALGPGALCGLTFVWGLRRIAASHASILTLLEPFVAVGMAALFLGQSVRAISLVGGVLILVGAVLVITPQRPKPPKPQAAPVLGE